jgi:GMP synthase-like glutamine amidotransferase
VLKGNTFEVGIPGKVIFGALPDERFSPVLSSLLAITICRLPHNIISSSTRAEVRQRSHLFRSLCQEPTRLRTKNYHERIMLDDADAVSATVQSEQESVLTKVVGDPSADTCRTLRFVMLGCEPSPPYGPNHHTAELLLDLIGQAAVDSTTTIYWTISIRVYDVQKGEYPADSNEWNSYDGVLLPGSFASAYDESASAAWILTLARVIQQEIVALQRPTLGICFGHQILAHSFATGCAAKVPTGPRAGRFATPLTQTGSNLLDWRSGSNGEDEDDNGNTIDIFYTHGDMVAQLPSVAVSLGGNEQVPIQAAAYFATPEDAAKVVQASAAKAAAGNSEQQQQEQQRPKPYAVSFQAHPEYASTRERELGMHGTLELSLDKMEKRGDLDREGRLSIGRDAQERFEAVERDSVHIMLSTGRLLGWFP